MTSIRIQHIVYNIIYGCILILVVGENCPFKECECTKNDIHCQGRKLKMIPPLTGEQIHQKYLFIQKNHISKIPATKLPPNLETIDFFENPITTIDDSAFDDSQNALQTLLFSEARFTRIPDAFLHLQVLTSLTVYNTWIKDWNENAMQHIAVKIEDLYLVNVSLHTWPTWLQNCTHLIELGLNSNFLSEIPDDGLDNVANTLKILDLSNNNLTAIPKTVSKLKVLQTFLLDNNRISYTSWLPLSSTLITLSLTNTHLVDAQSLSNDLRLYAESLTDINLVDNNLSEIPDLSFLSHVDSLDLSHNRISHPLAGSLHPSVTSLTLNYNFLPSIPSVYDNLNSSQNIQMTNNFVRDIFGGDIPLWIQFVDLSSNLITKLTDISFRVNSSIVTLTLTDNPIISISPNAFVNLQQLEDLFLENTKLSRLPFALASLASLTYLNMDDTTGLVCTCEEKSLREWVLTRQSSIDTSCGETSITFFFQYLSPACP